MSLERLQRRLQDIYELSVAEDVTDFLITDRGLADGLCGTPAPRACGERLLLRQDAAGLDISLYVDADVVAGLAAAEGEDAQVVGDLNRFCVALEGVSHFLYVVWHARHARSVSLLEMELQAEVDKYVVIRELLGGDDDIRSAPALIPRLFRSIAYHDELGPEEQRRYRDANRCAERYCRRLEAKYSGVRNRAALLKELRRFYRLPGVDKVREAARPH